MKEMEATLDEAMRAIRDADALAILAGAGMGVDSGLPDFRGNQGFWKAYPPFARLELGFRDLANPAWFRRDPALAWGFYGHRLGLYRAIIPHAGFAILRAWAESKPEGAWVFTSNVDGQFQKAGFDPAQIWECHGSIHHLQCSRPCTDAIWPADNISVGINEATLRAELPLPTCPHCGAIARPNVLMFQDGTWLSDRADAQEADWNNWLAGLGRGTRLAIVECGAGLAIATVRSVAEWLSRRFAAPLIRINPTDPQGPPNTLSISLGAKAALEQISQLTGNIQS